MASRGLNVLISDKVSYHKILTKYWTHEIGCQDSCQIPEQLKNSKRQTHASEIWEILRQDVLPNIEMEPCCAPSYYLNQC